jgi:addiction module HigA family antidote
MAENLDTVELLDNPHPGETLKEDFLEPLGVSAYRLAKATGLSQGHVADLIKGKRNITPETAIRLSAALGTSAEFWMRLQAHYDLLEIRRKQANQSFHVTRLVGSLPV